jgi:hypothetical protein
MGIAVFAGMIGVTGAGVRLFLTPVFYVAHFAEGSHRKEAERLRRECRAALPGTDAQSIVSVSGLAQASIGRA